MGVEQMRDDPDEVERVEKLKKAAQDRALAQKDDDAEEVRKIEDLKKP